MNCKNCGAPIEKLEDLGYWRHVREVHTGRIWCFPKADQDGQDFTKKAEPKLLWCDECHCNHSLPEECPYDSRYDAAVAADIEFDRRQERLGEYNDL